MSEMVRLLQVWLCVFVLVNGVSVVMARYCATLAPVYQRAMMTAIIVPTMVYGILPLLSRY